MRHRRPLLTVRSSLVFVLTDVLLTARAGGTRVKIKGRTILIGLGVLLLALIVWHDPTQAGNTASNWIDNVGNWFQDAFDKANEFAESVVE
jgi:hypothetical protein